MTDLFGNAIEEPGKQQAAKTTAKPHSVALQPLSHQPPPIHQTFAGLILTK